jgi:uncharacterized protein YjbJ (UPF0337 family)
MNKDQVKGKTKEVIGRVQQEAGNLTGSMTQQVKGLAKQVEGKAQKNLGDAKQAAEDINKGNRH